MRVFFKSFGHYLHEAIEVRVDGGSSKTNDILNSTNTLKITSLNLNGSFSHLLLCEARLA